MSPTSEGAFLLLDGQQRANAISLGYQNNTEKSESILWLDLGKELAKDIEQNDGSKKRSDRKFFFMVTTKSQPWGYSLSDNETSNKLLSASEKKEAVKEIGWSRIEQHDRPSPSELWPYKAVYPVPFSVLREYIENNPGASFNDFISYCQFELKDEPNWLRNLTKKIQKYDDNYDTAVKMWDGIKSGIINILKSTQVLIQVITNLSDYETSVFFRRMNKSGVVPNDEEIRYSMLKARIPELKDLDSFAEQRMPPAVLADIAISSFVVQKDQEWCSGVTYLMINKLLRDCKDSFSSYVLCEDINSFKETIKRLETILKKENKINHDDCCLPAFLYSAIAKKQNRGLYRLLLFVVQKWKDTMKTAEEQIWWRSKLVALTTLVCWFKHKDNMISDGYAIYQKCKDITKDGWELCTKQWLFESVQRDVLIPPPPLDAYIDIDKVTSPAYGDGISRTWGWRSESGQALLLYACRKYIAEEFLGYNPSDAVWAEENRPWDYDHIIPQSWLISGQGNRRGDFHGLVNLFLNSIGNIAPIPFDKNREKHDAHPQTYLEDKTEGENKNRMVFVDPRNYTGIKSPSEDGYLENDKKKAEDFSKIVLGRFYDIYKSWYQNPFFSIDTFFNHEDKRRKLFKEIRKRLEIEGVNAKVFYAARDGRQYECICNADWARPWISIIVENTNNNVSPAVTANNSIIEFGLRRHPSQNSINGQDKWWTKYEKISYENESSNPDFLANKILDMVESPENSN